MLHVLPPTKTNPATLFVCKTGSKVGGKTHNIAIQLVLQKYCKTSCTFYVARFAVALGAVSYEFYQISNSRERVSGDGVNRQPSKRFFFTVNGQKCTAILTVKTFQGNSNLAISADLHGFLTPEEYRNRKNQFPRSQKHSVLVDITRPYTTCLYL